MRTGLNCLNCMMTYRDMQKIVFFASILVFPLFVNAQSPSFEWAKSMGGIAYDFGTSIVVDASGNVYTTGSFYGTVDFDPGAGTFNLVSSGLEDIFVSKLDAAGNLLWATNMGGALNDRGNAIAVDGSGTIHITGYFDGPADFDPGSGTFSLTAPGFDVFILKLDGAGNFVWAKTVGGVVDNRGISIALDGLGNVYTTGHFSDGDFDPGPGIFNLTSNNSSNDIFILKLDASGNFVWAKAMGGNSSNEEGRSIAIDESGNVYTTGYFSGQSDFDPGAETVTLTSAGLFDIFISELDAAGNFVRAIDLGGTLDDSG